MLLPQVLRSHQSSKFYLQRDRSPPLLVWRCFRWFWVDNKVSPVPWEESCIFPRSQLQHKSEIFQSLSCGTNLEMECHHMKEQVSTFVFSSMVGLWVWNPERFPLLLKRKNLNLIIRLFLRLLLPSFSREGKIHFEQKWRMNWWFTSCFLESGSATKYVLSCIDIYINFFRGHGNESCNLIGSLPGQYFPISAHGPR